MSFSEWMNSKMSNLHWTDISLIKLSTAAFILVVAKLWTPILSLEWYWYLVIALVAGIKPVSKMFG
jgi:hypothetical protein|tara:strand:- start:604 stop:801 length:198 start_codon:yes stop_codon:yes gene_type:complete